MQITNGSVSRTYRPADFEGRTVSLSYTVDPGEDAEAVTATVAAIVERQARAHPAAKSGPTGPTPAQTARLAATLTPPQPTEPVEEPDPPAAVEITNDAMQDVFRRVKAKIGPEPIKELIAKWAAPKNRAQDIPQDKRAGFLAELNARATA